MADIPEYVQKTLDDFKQVLAQKLEEVRSALADLNILERRYNLEPTAITEVGIVIPDGERIASENRFIASSSRTSAVTTGTFVGLMPLEAAKRYIDAVKRAVEFPDIVEAVIKGNAAIPNNLTWKDDLEMRLSRSPDVLKVGEHTYGLTKHYTPDQVRQARAARRPVPTAKPKRRRRKRVSANSAATSENKKPDLKLLEPPLRNTASGTES